MIKLIGDMMRWGQRITEQEAEKMIAECNGRDLTDKERAILKELAESQLKPPPIDPVDPETIGYRSLKDLKNACGESTPEHYSCKNCGIIGGQPVISDYSTDRCFRIIGQNGRGMFCRKCGEYLDDVRE